MPSEIITEETTTLPEGAKISVYKEKTTRHYKSGDRSTFRTMLYAQQGEQSVRMKIEDDVSAAQLNVYLKLMVREITRRRLKLTKKPEMGYLYPQNLDHFVQSMAALGMFILEPWANDTGASKKTIQRNR